MVTAASCSGRGFTHVDIPDMPGMWAWSPTRIWAWSPTAMENGEHDETIKTLQAPTFGEVMAEYEVSLLCAKRDATFLLLYLCCTEKEG